MDIFIYGTKDGARSFHQTSQGVASVFDDCRGFGNGKSKGQNTYSIEYTKSGVALTKWIIVDDTLRGSIGFIAFAIEVEKDKILEGRKVKVLLDELLSTYKANYLTDRFEIKEVNEVWDFVNNLKQNYQSQLRHLDPKDAYSRGEKDAAFIYYSSEEELQEYLDLPYQEDYREFKRVFFVDQKYKDKEENPLKALRHNGEADLTGREILKNLRYQVYFQSINNGISTKVAKAGITIQNGEKVHPKDDITITFSKKNYNDDGLNGTIAELKEKNDDRVIVNEHNKELTIKPPDRLLPKPKSISFSIRNWKNEQIENPEIALKSKSFGGNKKIENNQVTFEGDELDQEWVVIINDKTEDSFIPNSLGNQRTIEIKNEKVVEFIANVRNFTLSVRDQNRNIEIIRDKNKIKFINEAIERSCTVTIKADKFKDKEIDPFFPNKNDGPIKVFLEEKKILKFNIQAGKGKINGKDYVEIYEGDNLDYEEIKKRVKPPKRMRFKSSPFEVTQSDSSRYKANLTAQYEKKPKFYKSWIFISAVVVFLTVLIMGYLNRDTISFAINSFSKQVERLFKHSDGSVKKSNEETPANKNIAENVSAEAAGDTIPTKKEEEVKVENEEPQKPKESIPAEKAPPNPPKESSIKTASIDTVMQAEFENEFWSLINRGIKKKEAYDNLIKKYGDISSENEIKKFYDNHLSTTQKYKEFSKKFGEFSDLQLEKLNRSKSLTRLEELLK